jgi:hypothetical protein
VEGFSKLLQKAQRENQIRGVKFGATGPHLTHLLFADDSIVFLEAKEGSLNTLKRVLQEYEVSSGQKVNLTKSSIYFGEGLENEEKERLKGIIGINCEAISEKYLGLPTVVGRSKEGAFKHIREKSQGKVAGLKGQGLSKEGRSILVKSVLQSVSAYTMSCFHFSKKLCKQLSSISSHFWWGAADGKRKVHWIGWDKMCRSKSDGGLGFRDYKVFNQALLAKQGWRLVTDPNSLCARVLKARYYKNGDFMEAKCPKRASFTWRGILHGRELLRKGLIWRIGDGTKVSAWNDQWIPRAGSLRPLGREPGDELDKVSELLLSNGQEWDENKLRQHFAENDVSDILQTPVGRPGSSDFLA